VLYVTEPTALVIGQQNMAVEAGVHVQTIKRWKRLGMPTESIPQSPGRPVDAIIAQSLWAVQSGSWLLDVQASQKNGALGGRPVTTCSAGSNIKREA
jgi:hypothetical protein